MGEAIEFKELVDLFVKEFRLCKVQHGETVAILSDTRSNAGYVQAGLAAASQLGADAFNLNLLQRESVGSTGGANPLVDNRPAIDALKMADFMVDLVFLLFSREQIELQQAGTRILTIIEPPETLKRMLPDADLGRRVAAAARRLERGQELRFTNHAGTNVTYRLGAYPTLGLRGFVDSPGSWDSWPSGFIFTGAGETEVNGRVVMDRGDIVFPFGTQLNEPVNFEIRDGLVVEINGSADAARLRGYIASFDDPKAWAVSHIGWGLNDKAEWTVDGRSGPGVGIDGRAYYGNVLFSTGPNTELGGKNDTACHLDLPMRNCSLWLDGEPVVRDGELVPEDLRAPGR
jgi:2,5-dihydroxypyridine 5,6-dioxygenase